MKTKELSIIQRIFAVFLYVLSFTLICKVLSGNWSFLLDSNNNYNLLFVSGALLLIFGTYIAEPYFTKPVDVITNSVAVVLALLSVKDPEIFVGYWPLLFASLGLTIFSIIIIFLSRFPKIEKTQKIFFKIITKIGQSRIIFSIIYLLTIVSYFGDKPLEFVTFLTFWVVFISQFLIESIVVFISKTFSFIIHNKGDKEILGEAIGCENPFLYKVEIDFLKHKIKNTKKGDLVYLSLENLKGAVGIIVNEKQLLNKKWLTVYLLEKDNIPLKIDLKKHEFISGLKTVFSKDNAVYLFDLNDIKTSSSKEQIENNYLYKNRKNFIGYIAKGSDINKIYFHSLVDAVNKKYQSVREGAVIKTKIYGQETLFQVIDGETNEERLEKHDVYGYLIGVAKKLGKYNQLEHEIETVKWLPNIYSPVFLDEFKSEKKDPLSIGKLPTTDFEIVLKEPNSLVTHNTAILGILGIGKSCLTFELIQKVIASVANIKVLCIDITGEYIEELQKYGCDVEELEITDSIKLLSKNYENIDKDIQKGGNHSEFRRLLRETFLAKFKEEGSGVVVFNPEDHDVSKQTRDVKPKKVGPGRDDWEDQAPMVDLTVAEKTRIISEVVLEICKETGKTKDARCLLVFEEAHSLVPEWNSAANKGDDSAANGTAKVILQGRKYGLGSFVVTQRTANISKSILNQCNTIFALRIFDDTGKQFLENYVGADYSNTLSTLEERHAVVVGKALKLKQPVIIKLNNMEEVKLKNK